MHAISKQHSELSDHCVYSQHSLPPPNVIIFFLSCFCTVLKLQALMAVQSPAVIAHGSHLSSDLRGCCSLGAVEQITWHWGQMSVFQSSVLFCLKPLALHLTAATVVIVVGL